MSLQGLIRGHWPSLVGGGLHFTISCMIWVLFGGLSLPMSEAFGLSATQTGFLVATPLLSGAFLRLVIGPFVDQHSPKIVGVYVVALEIFALLCGWLWGTSYVIMLGVGIFLGFAGTSFAVVVPIASQAYPPEHQGLAIGVMAMGNSGVLLTALFAPRLSNVIGWQDTFGLMIIPVFLTGIIFYYTVQDQSSSQGPAHSSFMTLRLLKDVLRQKFMYWLCFLYGVTFGGFVGLSSFLPIFFHDQYQIDIITAGTMTALCGLAGSVARPIGGHLADRFGGSNLLVALFSGIALASLGVGQLYSVTIAFFLSCSTLLLLGFGNGVVFQVVSTRFRHVMGTASGLIGAAGAFGGFLIPAGFGILKDVSDTFASGFWVLSCAAGLAGLSVIIVQRSMAVSVQQSV